MAISAATRLARELGAELALRAVDLVELLDDVNGHADGASLVGDGAGDGLADPPGGVGRELEALAVVELLGGADEPDRAFLDQVEERQALVAVALRDRDDEPEVGLHHRLLGGVVAGFDALCELHLLRGGEKRHLADVLEEELEGVGRDLRLGLPLLVGGLGGLAFGADDLDLGLVEGGVELVELSGVEVELVERERDLLGVELAGQTARVDERACLVRVEDSVDHGSRRTPGFRCAQGRPLSVA